MGREAMDFFSGFCCGKWRRRNAAGVDSVAGELQLPATINIARVGTNPQQLTPSSTSSSSSPPPPSLPSYFPHPPPPGRVVGWLPSRDSPTNTHTHSDTPTDEFNHVSYNQLLPRKLQHYLFRFSPPPPPLPPPIEFRLIFPRQKIFHKII